MIGRLLCRLGFHRWSFRDSLYGPTVVTFARCKRCDTPECVVNLDRIQRPW